MALTARDQAETLLINAIRSHDVHVRPEQLREALQGEQGEALIEWAIKHLGADNLLTTEELNLYNELDNGGHVDNLAELHDLAEVQAIHQEDMKAAIQELNRSTATINKQTETLRHQQDALSRLATKSADSNAQRHQLETASNRKSQTDKSRIATEVAELSRRVKFHISELSRDAQTASHQGLRDSLDAVFESDDRLLTSLQKLGWELDQPDPDAAHPAERLRETCLRLIKVTVETIRTRLDTTYLNTLLEAQRRRPEAVDDNDVAALQEEVESLYAEILPVAQMSVEQQHLEPAIKSSSSQSGKSLIKTTTALAYMNECLDYLLERIHCVQARIKAHQSHQAALKCVISTAQEETSEIPDTTKPNKKENPSPINVRGSSSRDHRRRSSGFQEMAPLDALLLTLSLPAHVLEGTDGVNKTTALNKALQDRLARDRDLSHSAQDSLESAAISQLHDARQAIQRLRDSLVAESSFGDVTLADAEIQQSIQVLGQEVKKAKSKLNTMDLHIQIGRSEKKEELLERWTR